MLIVNQASLGKTGSMDIFTPTFRYFSLLFLTFALLFPYFFSLFRYFFSLFPYFFSLFSLFHLFPTFSHFSPTFPQISHYFFSPRKVQLGNSYNSIYLISSPGILLCLFICSEPFSLLHLSDSTFSIVSSRSRRRITQIVGHNKKSGKAGSVFRVLPVSRLGLYQKYIFIYTFTIPPGIYIFWNIFIWVHFGFIFFWFIFNSIYIHLYSFWFIYIPLYSFWFILIHFDLF